MDSLDINKNMNTISNSNSKTLATLMEKDGITTTTTKTTMASLLSTTMSPQPCKTLVLNKNFSRRSHLSYFLNINFLHRKQSTPPNLRIKIPKLLANAVGINPNKRNTTGGNSLLKKFKSLLKVRCVSVKPNEASGRRDHDSENTCNLDVEACPRDGESDISSISEEEVDSHGSEYSESFRTTSICSVYSLDSEDWLSNNSLSLEFPALEQDCEIKEERICPTCKRPFDWESSFKKFLAMATPLKFIKGKYGTVGSSSSSASVPSHGREGKSGTSKYYRKFVIKTKVRKSCSPAEKVNENVERNEEDEADKELCKKRILMGERCRPLRNSRSYKAIATLR